MVYYKGKNYTEQYGLKVMEADLALLNPSDPNYQSLYSLVLAQRKKVAAIESSYTTSNWDDGTPQTGGNYAQEASLLSKPWQVTQIAWDAADGLGKINLVKQYLVKPSGVSDAVWNSSTLAHQQDLMIAANADNSVVVNPKTEEAVSGKTTVAPTSAPTSTLIKLPSDISAAIMDSNKVLSQLPEYIAHTITDSDAALVKNLYKLEDAKALNLANQKYMESLFGEFWKKQGVAYANEAALEAAQFAKLGQTIHEGFNDVKTVVTESFKSPLQSMTQQQRDLISSIDNSLKLSQNAALTGMGQMLKDYGLPTLGAGVNMLQDQLVKYLGGLAASQLAFKQAEVQMTKLSSDYQFGLGAQSKTLENIRKMQDQINNSMVTSVQIPLQSFAESLGQFRGYYNMFNTGVGQLQSSGKYRYSNTPKKGYLKSKYGGYYYQLVR